MILALALSPALDVTYLVEQTALGAIHRPQEVHKLAGGKAFNVARAAITLGTSARVIAPLGGHTGATIEEMARTEGIEVERTPVSRESRCCVSILDRSDGRATEFYEPPPWLGPTEWDAYLGQVRDAPPGAWSVVSGRLPEGMDTSALAGTLLGRRQQGDRIAIDCSGESARELVVRVRPDVVKVNRAEAAELVGCAPTKELAELSTRIRDFSQGTVVVTDGPNGALATSSAGTWSVAPDSDPGEYAIGSGDSFMAGLATSLDRGSALPKALLFASAAGSANTRRIGAGRFDYSDVVGALSRLQVGMVSP